MAFNCICLKIFITNGIGSLFSTFLHKLKWEFYYIEMEIFHGGSTNALFACFLHIYQNMMFWCICIAIFVTSGIEGIFVTFIHIYLKLAFLSLYIVLSITGGIWVQKKYLNICKKKLQNCSSTTCHENFP